MWAGIPRIFFVLTLVANYLIWSQSRYSQIPATQSHLSRRGGLVTRSLFSVVDSRSNDSLFILNDNDDCNPIAFPPAEQCAVVRKECPRSDTFLSIQYLRDYFCAKPSIRPLVFTGYVIWLLFLFSTLGISASDFFCPNLSTLAQMLHMDENVAGVTFLAFGNGSPDVFATFSAMRSQSGGLAIGELLGAAAFVTSVVAGSMCIIKPFRVNPGPFLRDVGFFTFAVVILLVVLWDGRIELWEALSLVGLYVIYVSVVIVGTWYENRKERKRQLEELMRDEYRTDVSHSPYRDDPGSAEESIASPTPSTLTPGYSRIRAISSPGLRPTPPQLGLELPPRPHTRSSSPNQSMSTTPLTPHLAHMPSFSLIGALEFRRVVSELQQQAAVPSLGYFDSPATSYPGGHYHHHHPHHSPLNRPGSRSRSPVGYNELRDPWDAALGVPLNDRSPQPPIPQLSEDQHGDGDTPLIMVTPHSPEPTAADSISLVSSQQYSPPSKRHRTLRLLGQIYHIICPTLREFRDKSFWGKIAAVFATPAVMALTLTLPVVVSDFTGQLSPPETPPKDDGRLVDFEEEGIERTLIAEEEVEVELHELKFNKWLMAVQCVLGPLFVVGVLFDGAAQEPWLLLAAGITGITIGILVAVFAQNGEGSSSRLIRCTFGFLVAIVWIMAIADEVVEVLKTFGEIFGLSDAIIGITIFAMGNSLADLVANMSIAVLSPIMGFSACFGGPMLNILLGIGISGTYVIRQTGEAYDMQFSTSLVITGMSLLGLLLATLVFVPWNDYYLPRKWGFALIFAYTCIMIANVIVEVRS